MLRTPLQSAAGLNTEPSSWFLTAAVARARGFLSFFPVKDVPRPTGGVVKEEYAYTENVRYARRDAPNRQRVNTGMGKGRMNHIVRGKNE